MAGDGPLVSWWDVERFAAERFYSIGNILERRSALLAQIQPPRALSKPERDKLIGFIDIAEYECLKLSLEHSADDAEALKKQIFDRADMSSEDVRTAT
jgi:hypothetical protein